MDTPQAIFTSFKLPKPNTNGSEKTHPDSGHDRCSMSPLPLPLKRTSESPKPLALCQPSLVVSGGERFEQYLQIHFVENYLQTCSEIRGNAFEM
jgi:hypothetical protein